MRGEYAGRARVPSNGGGRAGATCTTAVPPFAARLGTSAVPVATTVPSAPSTLAVSPAVGAACVPLFWHVTERPTVALAWDGCAVTERGAGGGAGLGQARVGSALHCGGLDWRVRHRTLSSVLTSRHRPQKEAASPRRVPARRRAVLTSVVCTTTPHWPMCTAGVVMRRTCRKIPEPLYQPDEACDKRTCFRTLGEALQNKQKTKQAAGWLGEALQNETSWRRPFGRARAFDANTRRSRIKCPARP